MNSLIVKYIKNEPITKQDIYDELYEICDSVHASCGSDCPVYELNGCEVPMNEKKDNCICFKNGKEMLKFINSHGGLK